MSLEKNLEQITKYNPKLAQKISKHTNIVADMRFEKAKNGNTSLMYEGIAVHSLEDPQQEAAVQFNTIKNKTKSAIIILIGLGLGYLFKRIYDSSAAKIIVYEPNIDILRLIMEAVDLSKELADPRVKIVSDQIELRVALSKMYGFKNTLDFSTLPSGLKLYADEIEHLKKELPSIVTSLAINYTTLYKKAFEWLRNGIKAIPYLPETSYINNLKDAFKDKPAIIVSPGPSLNKTIDYIKANREKVIVFCVNPAYKVLNEVGIEPDFILAIDSHTAPVEMLKDYNLSKSALITLPVCSDRLLSDEIKTSNKLIYLTNNDLVSRWLAEKSGLNIEEYVNKGSVSYCALSSAYIMGCNPIILTGQDLAFSGGQVYAGNSFYGNMEETIKEWDKKLEDPELTPSLRKHYEFRKCVSVMKFKQMNDPDVIDVEGQQGETLTTSKDYMNFKKYFEEFAYTVDKSKTRLINSSPGGANIIGYENADLNDTLAGYSSLDLNVCEIVNDIAQNQIEINKEKYKHIQDGLIELKSVLESQLPNVKKGLSIARSFDAELKKYHPKANKINKLTQDLLGVFNLLQSNLFSKHQILIMMAWQELTEVNLALDALDISVDLNNVNNFSKSAKALFEILETRVQEVIRTI